MHYLCTDNSIYLKSSDGAMLSYDEKYVVEPEKNNLVLKEALIYDGYADKNNPWFFGDASCYDEINGYNVEKMKSITTEEASSIMNSYEITDIQLNSFAQYIPQGDMSTEDAMKKALKEKIGDEVMVYFVCDDFDADGAEEGFGITGINNDWSLENVKVYAINKDKQVTCVAEMEELYGYGGTYLKSPDINSYIIMEVSGKKFLSLGGMEGQEIFLYGIRTGDVYQPKVSGQHSNFYKSEDGVFYAEPHEGGPGYYKDAYEFDAKTGEFVCIESK